MANDTIYLGRISKPTKKYVIYIENKHVQEVKQDKHCLTIYVDKEVFEKLGFKC